jgi:FkbH-like protein
VSDGSDAALAALHVESLELSEVTRLVSELERTSGLERTVTFGLSGNITVDLLGTYLRKQALLHGHRAQVQVGDFGDHPGNMKRFAADGTDAVILLDLFDAFVPAFESRIPLLGQDFLEAHAERFRSELAWTLSEARGVKHVFVSLLHRLSPPTAGSPSDEVDGVVAAFNDVITSEAARVGSVHVVSTGALSAQLGWGNAHDVHSYQRFRAPFTPAFFDRFAEQTYRLTRGFGAYFYKALVLDGDNTLWGGILGDDLVDGIKLGPYGFPGSQYWEAQHDFLSLQRHGVLLGLCSKNNPADVDEVLATHPHMVLRDEHFVAKRVNWDDKAANLEGIAKDLNIGLESIVFVDDSPFECEAIRNQLPMVQTLQVPAKLFEYPTLVRRIKELFAVDSVRTEGPTKTDQYRLLSLATQERTRHATQDEYLASLELTVTLQRNDRASAGRIAELTQKSNQFNLTTRRYTVSEVDSLMDSASADVYSVHVADKFGDSGLTGVVIVKYVSPETAVIDTFLLSCRVLGRRVELSFWNHVMDAARARRCRLIDAEYLPTAKNAQVHDFWDRLGLGLVGEDPAGRRNYRVDLSTAQVAPQPEHVKVAYVP